MSILKIKNSYELPTDFTGEVQYSFETNGPRVWYLNGKIHKDNGPAVEYCDGRKEWYQHDDLHRADGPAIEYRDGSNRWYYKGRYVTPEEHLELVLNACETDEEKMKILFEINKWK